MDTTGTRRSRHALACALWLMAMPYLAGCWGGRSGFYGGPAFSVGTVYGPGWYPDYGFNTFSIVRYPWWGDPPPPPENDPMREHSVTQRAIAEQVRESFVGRGYKNLPREGDVDVAVYASSQSQLDITGYTHDYDWKSVPQLKTKMKYPKGTVLVDVLAPKTHQLLWRGETVAPVSSNVDEYQSDLRKAVDRVVAKFPKSKH